MLIKEDYMLHKLSLTRKQRIALARILSDLIDADFIVEEQEMDFFESLISKDCLHISESMLVEAKKLDLAKAVSILQELDAPQRLDVLSLLKQLALSDGVCVPLEAVLILSLELALTHGGRILSIPKQTVSMDNMNVIYVENDFHPEYNRQLEQHYTQLDELFSQMGWEWVYIPHVIKGFTTLSTAYLHKVIRYMIPSAESAAVERLSDKLRQLTTGVFCRDLLVKRFGIDLLDAPPSLLLKINDSDVIELYEDDYAERIAFSNYLILTIEDDIVAQASSLKQQMCLLTEPVVRPSQEILADKFRYSGFLRLLFDLTAFGKEQKEYRLVLTLSHHKGVAYFESLTDDTERILLRLNPQEFSLYWLIVTCSLEGKGLDWREQLPKEQKQRLLQAYNKIYHYVGKANCAYEFKDRIQVHHIKNKIRANDSVVNLAMFLPEVSRQGEASYCRVRATRDFIVLDDSELT